MIIILVPALAKALPQAAEGLAGFEVCRAVRRVSKATSGCSMPYPITFRKSAMMELSQPCWVTCYST